VEENEACDGEPRGFPWSIIRSPAASLRIRRLAVRFLATFLPDFFPVYGNMIRGSDAEPYGFAFDRDDPDC